ncbi:MAG: hypothetical protein RLY14_3018 [Planctomycetota bacterium]|jgi:MFS family permease
MHNSKTDWWILTLAAALTAFGSALTWTGLPYFVAKDSGNVSHMLGLFVAETVASVLMILLSGAISLRWSSRTILIVTELSCGVVLSALYLGYDPLKPHLIYIAGVIMASIASLSTVPLKVLTVGLMSETQLEMWWARRGMIVIVAKLAGTAAGPILFESLGVNAILFDIATYMLGAIGIWMIGSRSGGKVESQSKLGQSLGALMSGFAAIISRPRGDALLILQFASGALGMPLTAAAVSFLQHKSGGDPYPMSAYWVLGFFAAFTTNALLGTGWLDRMQRSRIYFGTMILISAGLFLLGMANSWVVVIAAQMVLTVGRVSADTYLFGLAYRFDESDSRPLTLASADAIYQLGAAIGMVSVLLAESGLNQQWIWIYGTVALGMCFCVWQKAFSEEPLGTRMDASS